MQKAAAFVIHVTKHVHHSDGPQIPLLHVTEGHKSCQFTPAEVLV